MPRLFALTAQRETIVARIDGGDEAHGWRHQNLDRCLRAFATDDFGERIDTDDRTPLEVAELIRVGAVSVRPAIVRP